MQRPPWGELSTFEWSEDLRRLQSGQQVATYAMKPSYRKTHRGNIPGAAAEIQVDGEAGGLIDIFATAAAETLVGYR